MKYHIEKNTVQETLVIPLFGRLVCSERFPELFSDPAAKRICDSLDYDFAEKRKKMESPAGLFGALTVIVAGLVVPAMPYLLSFAAGAMLYVVVEELIPEMSAGRHSD